MKVKLKGSAVRKSYSDCIDGKFLGIDLYTWKKINRGETVDIIEIPEEAKEHLVSVESKIKKKTIKKIKKIVKEKNNGN